MDNLLNEALHAAGGIEIWKKYSTLIAQIKIHGASSWLDSDPELLDNLTFQADLSGQSAQLRNFPKKGLYTLFTNHDTTVFDEKDNEITVFDPAWGTLYDASLQSPWHAIQMMYFIKYTLWKILTFPFSLTTPEYEYEETQGFTDKGRHYRSLMVETAKRTPYGRMMSLFFGSDNLLSRTDYETQDGNPVLFTIINSEYTRLSGILVPALIQIYYRQNDGTYSADDPLIRFEVKSLKFI